VTAWRRVEKNETKSADEAIRDYIASHKSGIGRLVFGLFEIRTLEEAEKLSTMLANNYPRLLRDGDFAEEVTRRLALPRYAGRVASVEFRRTRTMIRLRVTDEGPGFDFRKYLQATPLADGPNGRGILIASKFSFDKVVYHGKGNVVDGVIRL
jgi:hypothetical protein